MSATKAIMALFGAATATVTALACVVIAAQTQEIMRCQRQIRDMLNQEGSPADDAAPEQRRPATQWYPATAQG